MNATSNLREEPRAGPSTPRMPRVPPSELTQLRAQRKQPAIEEHRKSFILPIGDYLLTFPSGLSRQS